MLLKDTHICIIVYYLYYSGGYQDESESLKLYRDINNYWGLEPKQNKKL